MNINSSRLIKLAALILLVATVYYAASQFTGKGKTACSGLACYDDSDCGSACHCELASGSKPGKCGAR